MCIGDLFSCMLVGDSFFLNAYIRGGLEYRRMGVLEIKVKTHTLV